MLFYITNFIHFINGSLNEESRIYVKYSDRQA